MNYIHQFAIGEAVAGCYSISAFDSVGNESLLSPLICIDSCNYYEIPNVFTPNNDGRNDILLARTTGQVEKVDFRLFNRSGSLIFRTEDPRINWNGTHKGQIMQPGVYFYQCDVYERRITGLETFSLSGFIHLITEKGAEPVIIEY
jgi:gliding motility-associated-like protein